MTNLTLSKENENDIIIKSDGDLVWMKEKKIVFQKIIIN